MVGPSDAASVLLYSPLRVSDNGRERLSSSQGIGLVAGVMRVSAEERRSRWRGHLDDPVIHNRTHEGSGRRIGAKRLSRPVEET